MSRGFIMSEPKSTTCTRLSEVMEISPESVNRFWWRESSEPKDWFNQAKSALNLEGGTRSVDDSTLDQPYSQYMALVGHFWSGKHHRVVKGINLITRYYTDIHGQHLPVNYRLDDQSEGKTKNDYGKDMLAEVLAWGLKPVMVTGDSWYSGTANLQTVTNDHMGFRLAVESHRTVSIQPSQWVQVKELDLPEDGLIVWLRNFGKVKRFRTQFKDQLRHDVVHLTDAKPFSRFDRTAFQHYHDHHWQIEQYHRVIKQVGHLERFQVRQEIAIRNHWFTALCGYVYLQRLKATDVIANAYRLPPDWFKNVIASVISAFMHGKDYLNSQFCNPVNA
jgi:hypothetical protein